MMAKSTLRTLFLAASGVMLLASCNESLQNVVSSSGDGSVHVAPRLASTSIIPSKTASVKAVLTSGNSSFQDSIAYPGGDSLVLKDVPKGAAYRLVLVGKTTASKVLWGADTTVASADSSVTLLSLFTVDSLAKPALQGGTTVTSLTVSKDTTVHLSTSSLAANQILYYSTGAGASVYDASSGISVSAGQTLKAWVVARLVSGVDSLISADTMAVAIKKNVSPTSTDTTLASLSVKTGKLTPSFSSNVTSYTDTIFLPTTSETITAVANAANATITGDGDVTGLGELMVGGSKVQTITVTNNGKSLTYKVTVVMAKATPVQTSIDTTLTALSTTPGKFKETFAAGTKVYTDTVDDTATKLTVSATAKVATNSISYNGGTSSTIALTSTTPASILVKVTNANTNSLTYTINLVRRSTTTIPTSIDTMLTSLSTAPGKFKETFASGTTTYTDTVDDTVTKFTVHAKAKVAANTITYNGKSDSVITLTLTTPASILVKVTNANTNSLTYTINLVRRSTTTTPTSIDTMLTSLSTTPGKFKETFASGTTTYTDTVDDTVTKLTVHAKSKVAANTITYNGKSDSAIALTSTTPAKITVTVTNANKNSLGYTINLVRRSTVVATVDSTLSALSVDAGTLTPTFDAGILSYTDTIDTSTTKSVTVSATASDPKGLVWFNNAKSTHTATKSVTTFPSTLTVSAVVGNSSTDYTINFVVKPPPAPANTFEATKVKTSLTQGTLYTVSYGCGGDQYYRGGLQFASPSGPISATVVGPQGTVSVTGSYSTSVDFKNIWGAFSSDTPADITIQSSSPDVTVVCN